MCADVPLTHIKIKSNSTCMAMRHLEVDALSCHGHDIANVCGRDDVVLVSGCPDDVSRCHDVFLVRRVHDGKSLLPCS